MEALQKKFEAEVQKFQALQKGRPMNIPLLVSSENCD
jgi:hypothetical protein